MRISELARRADVSIATVKFYLREGLLPAGRATSRRSALYDEGHLERLRLLRVLREVGDVPINRLREVVAVLNAEDAPLLRVLATGVDALNPTREMEEPDDRPALAAAEAIIAQAGWDNVRADAPDRARLADLLQVVMSFGTHEAAGMDVLQNYVYAADLVGKCDVSNLDGSQSTQGLLSEVVVGQVVFGEVLLCLRRLAEEHYAIGRFSAHDAE